LIVHRIKVVLTIELRPIASKFHVALQYL